MATVIAPSQRTSSPEIVELVQARSAEFNWVFFVVIAAFHLGAVAALFTFHWSSVFVFLVMWLFGQNVGISISYHRQLTHRGFTTPKWLEYVMAICGTMALQGSPISGRCASHAPPIHRQAGRPAFSPRRQMVVAYGLDPAWRSS